MLPYTVNFSVWMLQNSCRQDRLSTRTVTIQCCLHGFLASVGWGFLSIAMLSECSVLAAVSCVAVFLVFLVFFFFVCVLFFGFFFLIFNTKFWAYYLSSALLLYREQATVALVSVPLTLHLLSGGWNILTHFHFCLCCSWIVVTLCSGECN